MLKTNQKNKIKMSNAKSYAESELELLFKTESDTSIREFVPEILALVNKFNKSGQSGGSAPYVAGSLSHVIKNLCLQEPICPITGLDDEWMEFTDGEYQNNRCSALFKKGKEGSPYYLDAIVWEDQEGIGWNGSALLKNGDELLSRQFIKSFPFEPKTFYIDVISKEVKKDDWEFYIKDEKQLDEVFDYYSRK